MHVRLVLLLLLASLAAAVVPHAQADLVTVSVSDGIWPRTQYATPGDDVRWTNTNWNRHITLYPPDGSEACELYAQAEDPPHSCTRTLNLGPGLHAYHAIQQGDGRHNGYICMADGATDVAFTTPAGSIVSDIHTITGTASSPGGVDHVEFRVGGGSWQPATGTESWSFDLDTSRTSDGPLQLEVRVTAVTCQRATDQLEVVVDNVDFGDIQVSRTYVTSGNVYWQIYNEGNNPATVTFTVEGAGTGRGWVLLDTTTITVGAFKRVSGGDGDSDSYSAGRVTITDITSAVPDAYPANNAAAWPDTHPSAAAMVRIGVALGALEPYVQIPAGQQAGWQWRDGGSTGGYGGSINHKIVSVDGEWCSTSSQHGHLCYRAFDTPGLYEYWCSFHPSQIQGAVRVLGAAPSLVVDSPTDGSTVGGVFTVSGSATAFHDLESVEVRVSYLDWMPATGTDAWSLALDANDLPGGWQEMAVRATDEYGQTATSTFDIYIDSPVWPDLTVASVSSGPVIYSNLFGGPVASPVHELRAEIALAGSADETADVLFEYFSNGDWHAIGTTNVTVPADGTAIATVNWIDPAVYGKYNVRVTVDPDDAVAENVEDNNTNEKILLHAVWYRNELGRADPLH